MTSLLETIHIENLDTDQCKLMQLCDQVNHNTSLAIKNAWEGDLLLRNTLRDMIIIIIDIQALILNRVDAIILVSCIKYSPINLNILLIRIISDI